MTDEVSRELRALTVLKQTLADLGHGEDGDLLLDMAEGETDILNVVDGLLRADLDDAGMLAGIKAIQDDLSARKARVDKRVETRRTLLRTVLDLLDQRKLERPAATISKSKVAPKVQVTTEADIPARFWKKADPVLDLKALKEALAADLEKPVEQRENIPGATLSNGGETLTIRRR